ncbi:hypothetical protein [Streptomyces sp. HM190]|uniref:hypothetical protein n=1 Tax=Streptomyces sp. HM190 TaxID=2695266 RepID=UPI001358EBF3|nr:hypothetical protein [Streptomyces sp. HM190]
MGSLRLTLCTGAVAAAALTAPAFAVDAADAGNVSVVPATPAPGTDIQVRAKGCEGRSGTAASSAFVADAQLTVLGGERTRILSGETRIRSSLKPGTYGVRVSCDGTEDKVKGTIEVGDGKQPPARPSAKPSAKPSVRPSASARPSGRPSAPASPVAPVRAGGGGAAALLAARPVAPADAAASADGAHSMDARNTGPGARHAVIGLVLAGVAAAVVVVRGARRGRGTK